MATLAGHSASGTVVLQSSGEIHSGSATRPGRLAKHYFSTIRGVEGRTVGSAPQRPAKSTSPGSWTGVARGGLCPFTLAGALRNQPTVLIMHSRTQRVHSPDPGEDSKDQHEWKTPCGWRYGMVSFYRLSDGAGLAWEMTWRAPRLSESTSD